MENETLNSGKNTVILIITLLILALLIKVFYFEKPIVNNDLDTSIYEAEAEMLKKKNDSNKRIILLLEKQINEKDKIIKIQEKSIKTINEKYINLKDSLPVLSTDSQVALFNVNYDKGNNYYGETIVRIQALFNANYLAYSYCELRDIDSVKNILIGGLKARDTLRLQEISSYKDIIANDSVLFAKNDKTILNNKLTIKKLKKQRNISYVANLVLFFALLVK